MCPTFQEWAKREAARVAGGSAPAASGAALAGEAGLASESAEDDEPQRNPPRDWAAPPPWLGGVAGGMRDDFEEPNDDVRGSRPGSAAAGAVQPPGFLAGREAGATGPGATGPGGPGLVAGAGLVGSAADLMARGDAPPPGAPAAAAGRPAQAAWAPPPVPPAHAEPDEGDWIEGDEDGDDASPDQRTSRRSAAGRAGAAAGLGLGSRRPSVGQARRRPPPDAAAPSWERPRRIEAYPTIRTRMGMQSVPPIALAAVAVLVAALALFFLPTLLGVGSPKVARTPPPTTIASVAPSSAVNPTAPPAATSQIYTVQPGDTMSKIASQFGVPLNDLIAANKDTIKNPNSLQIGQQVTIPAAIPSTIPASTGP